MPVDVCLDPSGNLYIADAGNARIRKVDAATKIITTIAGTGISAYGTEGDGGPASVAALSPIGGICTDAAGNIYLSGVSIIKKINAATGIITTIAGNGTMGYSGDDGPATDALLGTAQGICTDNAGNVYFADKFNGVIRKISAATGTMTTVAGTGVAGHIGDGGPASSALLFHPSVICINKTGDLLIADEENHTVRKVDATTGTITTIAGFYITVSGVSDDGGPATNALIGSVNGICTDTAGNIFITDISCSCRKIDAATNIITTVAGDGSIEGYSGDGGPANLALMNRPKGICYDPVSNNLIIADQNNNRIRRVSRPGVTAVVTVATSSYPYIFPNPSSGTINLRLPQMSEAQCEITNAAGRNIYCASIKSGDSKVDLTDQPTGTYFVTIRSAHGVSTQQVTIVR
jgi:sugar lactone lactonase YvrE